MEDGIDRDDTGNGRKGEDMDGKVSDKKEDGGSESAASSSSGSGGTSGDSSGSGSGSGSGSEPSEDESEHKTVENKTEVKINSDSGSSSSGSEPSEDKTEEVNINNSDENGKEKAMDAHSKSGRNESEDEDVDVDDEEMKSTDEDEDEDDDDDDDDDEDEDDHDKEDDDDNAMNAESKSGRNESEDLNANVNDEVVKINNSDNFVEEKAMNESEDVNVNEDDEEVKIIDSDDDEEMKKTYSDNGEEDMNVDNGEEDMNVESNEEMNKTYSDNGEEDLNVDNGEEDMNVESNRERNQSINDEEGEEIKSVDSDEDKDSLNIDDMVLDLESNAGGDHMEKEVKDEDPMDMTSSESEKDEDNGMDPIYEKKDKDEDNGIDPFDKIVDETIDPSYYDPNFKPAEHVVEAVKRGHVVEVVKRGAKRPREVEEEKEKDFKRGKKDKKPPGAVKLDISNEEKPMGEKKKKSSHKSPELYMEIPVKLDISNEEKPMGEKEKKSSHKSPELYMEIPVKLDISNEEKPMGEKEKKSSHKSPELYMEIPVNVNEDFSQPNHLEESFVKDEKKKESKKSSKGTVGILSTENPSKDTAVDCVTNEQGPVKTLSIENPSKDAVVNWITGEEWPRLAEKKKETKKPSKELVQTLSMEKPIKAAEGFSELIAEIPVRSQQGFSVSSAKPEKKEEPKKPSRGSVETLFIEKPITNDAKKKSESLVLGTKTKKRESSVKAEKEQPKKPGNGAIDMSPQRNLEASAEQKAKEKITDKRKDEREDVRKKSEKEAKKSTKGTDRFPFTEIPQTSKDVEKTKEEKRNESRSLKKSEKENVKVLEKEKLQHREEDSRGPLVKSLTIHETGPSSKHETKKEPKKSHSIPKTASHKDNSNVSKPKVEKPSQAMEIDEILQNKVLKPQKIKIKGVECRMPMNVDEPKKQVEAPYEVHEKRKPEKKPSDACLETTNRGGELTKINIKGGEYLIPMELDKPKKQVECPREVNEERKREKKQSGAGQETTDVDREQSRETGEINSSDETGEEAGSGKKPKTENRFKRIKVPPTDCGDDCYKKYQKDVPDRWGPVNDFKAFEEYIHAFERRYGCYILIRERLLNTIENFEERRRLVNEAKGKKDRSLLKILERDVIRKYEKDRRTYLQRKKAYIVLHKELDVR